MSVRAIISSVVLVILIAASSAVDTESDESPRIRMVSDSLREVEEAFVKILGQSRQVLSFARFTHKYGKKYQNEEEIKHRFSVFKDNLDFIRSTNKKGLSYKLGVTQFADLAFQEFQMSNSGAAPDSFTTLKGSHNLTAVARPARVDWREKGVVSPVKDQGLCLGGSWAFSATAAIESAIYLKTSGGMTNLSEQQLIDCSYRFQPNGTQGCVGGLPSQAFDYIISNGVTSEQEYPYIGIRGLCRLRTGQYRVSSYVSIGRNENALADVLASVGPAIVSFTVPRQLQLFKGTQIFDMTSCPLGGVRQHALAIGYGTEGGKDYWIIKNSWGERWGDKGYFKMARGKNMCGIADGIPIYPIV